MGFTGLVPTERSSGETIRRGHITKAGSTVVRTQSSSQRGPINTGPGLGRGCVNAGRTSPPTP
ncbi:MAG: Transposase family [Mycobacterium sp.]|nr:Transposase family [Mycobacterium sp.]